MTDQISRGFDGCRGERPPSRAATGRSPSAVELPWSHEGQRRKHRSSSVRAGAVCLVVTLVLSACVGSRDLERPPDDQFGHRFEAQGPEGRRTIAILPPDSAESYFYYPVVIDMVHVRPATLEAGPGEVGEVPVEVLVKGSLPDGCTELHDVSQERFGHIIHLSVRVRRPQGAVCTRVNRPYRFYVQLDGLYEEGHYTLKLNERIFPFAIRIPSG